MTTNDLLGFFFTNSPIVNALIALIWGFGSIVLIAIAVNVNVIERVIKNPAFIIGDTILVPASVYLITAFYQQVTSPLEVTSYHIWNIASLISAIIISISAGIKFKMLKKVWILHGLFYLFYVYILINFSSKALYQLLFSPQKPILWIYFIGTILLMFTHSMMGKIWPKKLF